MRQQISIKVSTQALDFDFLFLPFLFTILKLTVLFELGSEWKFLDESLPIVERSLFFKIRA